MEQSDRDEHASACPQRYSPQSDGLSASAQLGARKSTE